MVYLPNPLELELEMTDDRFFALCQKHRDLRFEQTAQGELIIMPPTGGITGDRNADITYQLRGGNRQTKLGKVFDSSTGFKLPNGAKRSPSASWISLAQWNALTDEEKEKFLPLCPDLVVELRSSSDALKPTQEKMPEYLENGAKLGWLIDPPRKVVEIYRPEKEVEILELENPQTVSGEDILPGFELEFSEIF